jgi:5-methyltetrahydrofolate--homocysteine methyltransferase
MSALLSTTLPFMRDTIEAIKEAGLRDKVKIMIGGGPVTQAYADKIGADGYGQDAAAAAENALALIS